MPRRPVAPSDYQGNAVSDGNPVRLLGEVSRLLPQRNASYLCWQCGTMARPVGAAVIAAAKTSVAIDVTSGAEDLSASLPESGSITNDK